MAQTALTGQILKKKKKKKVPKSILTGSREQQEMGRNIKKNVSYNKHYNYRDLDVYVHSVFSLHSPVQCKLEMLHNG